MNDTLKAAGRIGAELGAAKAENEAMRILLRESYSELLVMKTEVGFRGETLDLIDRIDAFLSQQPEPTDTFTAVDMATAAAQGFRDGQAAVEQATAQDEQSPEQMLSREQIENIARKVHGDCIRLPGATYQHAAEAAVMYTLERIARPAQTEQQPVAWLIDWPEEPELGHYFSDEPNEHARSRPLYAAPIAQTAPQPEQSGLVEATLPAVRAAERLSSAIIHRMTDRQYQKVRAEFGDLQDALAVCRAAMAAQVGKL
jgi:hypothetical protein